MSAPDKNSSKYYTVVFKFIAYVFTGGKKNNRFWIRKELAQTENLNVWKFFDNVKQANKYMCGIKIASTNPMLLNERQKYLLIEDFANIIKSVHTFAKLVKIDEVYPLENNLEMMLDLAEANNSGFFFDQAEAIKNLTADNKQENKTPAIYLLCISKKLSEIQEQVGAFKNIMFFKNLNIELCEQDRLKKVFWKLNNFLENSDSNFSSINQKNNKLKKYYFWALHHLPNKMNSYFWLSQLFDIPKLNIVINIQNVSKEQAKKRLDNAINKIATNFSSHKYKPSLQKEFEHYEESYDQVAEKINSDLDRLFDMSILLQFGGNKKECGKIRSALKALKNSHNWKYSTLIARQHHAWQSWVSDLDICNKDIGIEFTSDIFATSLPIPESSLLDSEGFILGSSTSGQPVLWDLFYRDSTRINSNIVILGTSGSGKSFLTKKIVAQHLRENNKIFIIDPENEYQKLTKATNGQWLDASSSKDNVINPLQMINNDEAETDADAYANHLLLMETFFKIISKKLKDDDEASLILNECLVETYQRKNITPDVAINEIPNDKWPILSDLQATIEDRITNYQKSQQDNINYFELNQLRSVLAIVKTCTKGQYGKFWNNHTKIKLDFDTILTTFNFQKLLDLENSKVKELQTLFIIRILKESLRSIRQHNLEKNAHKHILIVVDEAHLLISEDNVIALDFLFRTMKRIRKYNGSLIITTQNLNDFLSSSEHLRKKFTAIIDNSQYNFIGGLKQNDINMLSQLHAQSGGLSDAIINYISRANRGQFWFQVSQEFNMALQVDQSPYEAEMLQ